MVTTDGSGVAERLADDDPVRQAAELGVAAEVGIQHPLGRGLGHLQDRAGVDQAERQHRQHQMRGRVLERLAVAGEEAVDEQGRR